MELKVGSIVKFIDWSYNVYWKEGVKKSLNIFSPYKEFRVIAINCNLPTDYEESYRKERNVSRNDTMLVSMGKPEIVVYANSKYLVITIQDLSAELTKLQNKIFELEEKNRFLHAEINFYNEKTLESKRFYIGTMVYVKDWSFSYNPGHPDNRYYFGYQYPNEWVVIGFGDYPIHLSDYSRGYGYQNDVCLRNKMTNEIGFFMSVNVYPSI